MKAMGRTRVGSRGKAPVGSLGDKVPQKLKQNVKFVQKQFLTFLCRKYRIRQYTGAELKRYILQSHNSKNSED